MKVLVTGGAGYVGSVVAEHLVVAGHEVIVLDDLSTGHRDAVPPAAGFVRADVTDAARVLDRQAGFDAVLHFAAKSLVSESMTDPARYWRANVAGTRALLDAARAAGVPRLIFSSTAAVYGDPDAVPIDEYAPTRPTNPYGSSKLAVDLMLTDQARAHGLAAVSLRYFNVAGAWHGLGERHNPETHLIPRALQATAGGSDPLVIYGADYDTPDGTCIRDYIHVADLAEAHLLALNAATPGTHRICNLGNGAGFSVRQILEAIERVVGRAVPSVLGPRRAGDPARLVAAAARARRELGWTPTRTDLDRIVADAWAIEKGRAR